MLRRRALRYVLGNGGAEEPREDIGVVRLSFRLPPVAPEQLLLDQAV